MGWNKKRNKKKKNEKGKGDEGNNKMERANKIENFTEKNKIKWKGGEKDNFFFESEKGQPFEYYVLWVVN